MAETRTSEEEKRRMDAGGADSQKQQSGDQRSLQSRESRGTLAQQGRHAYPSLWAVSPFELMRRLSDEMFRSVLAPAAATEERGVWAPRIEALQEDNEFVIRAELPGMNADDVTVDISEDAVTISGERRQERQDRRGGVAVSEISYGAFSRVIPLPDNALPDGAAATFRNGVLEIRVPAPPSEVRRGRRIAINEQSGQGQSGQSQSGQSQSQTSGQGQSSAQGQSSGSKNQGTGSR
jgi:HSP20 family protein